MKLNIRVYYEFGWAPEVIQVEATMCRAAVIPGKRFFYNRTLFQSNTPDETLSAVPWTISEFETGIAGGWGKNKAAALADLRDKVALLGVERVRARINEGKALFRAINEWPG